MPTDDRFSTDRWCITCQRRVKSRYGKVAWLGGVMFALSFAGFVTSCVTWKTASLVTAGEFLVPTTVLLIVVSILARLRSAKPHCPDCGGIALRKLDDQDDNRLHSSHD